MSIDPLYCSLTTVHHEVEENGNLTRCPSNTTCTHGSITQSIARFPQEDTYRGDGLNLCTHIGHTFGNEFWRLRDLAESQGLIQRI